MEKVYTTRATSVGGRDGRVTSADGVIDLELKRPVEMGGTGGANPETLFASGWSACFNGALNHIARLQRIRLGETKITVEVSLNKEEDGGMTLSAVIDAVVPGVSLQEAERLAHEAHQFCPYSKATRGNIEATLNVNNE